MKNEYSIKEFLKFKQEDEKMSFVYEMVGEENKELWESLGWKNWGEKPLIFSKRRHWSRNKQRNIFLIVIGGYIDMPEYYDMCYKGRIIRMEVVDASTGELYTGVTFLWKIENIYIPKSIWQDKDDILSAIADAFSVYTNLVPENKVEGISVEIECEPTCVEADYNGR